MQTFRILGPARTQTCVSKGRDLRDREDELERFRTALSDLFGVFRRQTEGQEEANEAFERMAREISGSIFLLVSLFELVSLASYIPLDSFSIFQGRLDHMNNLGGVVGAIVAEWFLGTVGLAGYSVVALTLWLAFTAFRGSSFQRNIFRILGVTVCTLLAAITLYLCLHERFPEASLLQGGMVGKVVGSFLERYFNTTGALLMVGGAFVITAIVTMGLSISRTVQNAFEGESAEAVDEAEAESEVPAPRALQLVPSPKTADAEESAKALPKKKRAPRKKKTDAENSAGETDEEDSAEGEENEAEGEADSGPPVFEELIPSNYTYSLPSLRLLKSDSGSAKKMSKGELKENTQKLIEHLLSFQITGEVVKVSQGPVLTTYEYKPSAGIKLSKIANLQDDLGVVLGTNQLRIIAPIPGKTVVGIEVPRPQTEIISLKDVMGEDGFFDKKLKIPIAIGKTTDGEPVFGDLTAMPHLLVAGGTGSGKSVFMNALIMSFIYRLSPQQLRLILVDPKMLEFRAFDGIPHLITNVITNNSVAFNALNWAVQEMDRRYHRMADTGSKNIESYNAKQRTATQKLPYIVVVVDELADLMMSGGELVEVAITRLAQKARASGIHLVLATQRPSTDVVTGLIKANMPSRLAFKVPSAIDSRTVLDSSGAEGLIGKGDCMMITPGVPLRRLHGCYVTEEDLDRVMKYVRGGKDHSKSFIKFSNQMPDGK